jgi:hypothetical protein
MKNDILWDVMLYSLVQVSLTFRKLLASCWLLAHFTLRHLIRRRFVPPERRRTSVGVQVVMSQKKILLAKLSAFITYQKQQAAVLVTGMKSLDRILTCWSAHAAP